MNTLFLKYLSEKKRTKIEKNKREKKKRKEKQVLCG